MTNFERWRLYTDDLTSPDSYINFGFYYIIAAALQRRVWIGPEHSPLFPNIYIILVGDPGVGKGLVIKQIYRVLTHHKMPDPLQDLREANVSPTDRQLIVESAKDDYENAKKQSVSERPLLFPMAADASTYEALVRALAESGRRKNVLVYDEALQKQVYTKPYKHCSLAFCLEEISSLFRKKAEDVVNVLIKAYDCGDYTYDTKTPGLKDRVKNCCLNFFGGTTPGFMQSTFDDKLLTEGFSSRTFFVYAGCNRKTAMRFNDLTDEQKEAYNQIIAHVKRLSNLYGRVEVTDEAWEFLENWWKEAQTKRPNISPKLNPYYARKNIHVLKMAMAMHFSDSIEMKMGVESFKKAIEFLAPEERKMHIALGFDKGNPLSSVSKKIIAHLQSFGEKTEKELLAIFYDELPNGRKSLQEVLIDLLEINKITPSSRENGVTGKIEETYRLTMNKSET